MPPDAPISPSAPSRVFLLSPAHCGGKRAGYLLRETATFDLAVKLRAGEATLGEVFQFLSGLYFRGKLAYSAAFAAPVRDTGSALVITTDRGLLPPQTRITLDDLRAMAEVPVHPEEPRYREPLVRDAQALAEQLGTSGQVVLLGSIATGKYADVLSSVLGDRLHFPSDFVGRGDMSRGALMLRRAAEGRELDYVPIAGAIRRGRRATPVG
jgi:hypothetical protein